MLAETLSPDLENQPLLESGGIMSGIKKVFSWIYNGIRNILGDTEAKAENDSCFQKVELQDGRATVKVIGTCKNPGAFIGLTDELKTELGVKDGDTVHILVGGAPPLERTVESIPSKEKGAFIISNDSPAGAVNLIRKPTLES